MREYIIKLLSDLIEDNQINEDKIDYYLKNKLITQEEHNKAINLLIKKNGGIEDVKQE